MLFKCVISMGLHLMSTIFTIFLVHMLQTKSACTGSRKAMPASRALETLGVSNLKQDGVPLSRFIALLFASRKSS